MWCDGIKSLITVIAKTEYFWNITLKQIDKNIEWMNIKNLIYVPCNDRRLKHLNVVVVDVAVHDDVARQLEDLHQDQDGQVQLHHLVLRDDLLSVVLS